MTNRCARPGFDTGPWAESSETVTLIFQSGPGSPLGDALWHLAFTA